jgi:hypothetical protein
LAASTPVESERQQQSQKKEQPLNFSIGSLDLFFLQFIIESSLVYASLQRLARGSIGSVIGNSEDYELRKHDDGQDLV